HTRSDRDWSSDVCSSDLFGIGELRKDQPGRIAWAKEMGLTQMLVPSLDGPKNPTLDDVKRAADEYNQMGERAAAAGISQGLHNEIGRASCRERVERWGGR